MKDQPVYFIQISAMVEDDDSIGLNSFLNMETTSKLDLVEISKDMWEYLQTSYKKDFNKTYNLLTTIAILDKNSMKILFSTANDNTNVNKIDKVLTIIDKPKLEKLNYECYRDDMNYISNAV
tara:strand:- start:175 stop:540 length:366 start_codon:yes stop_codon:yes gene_type:complete